MVVCSALLELELVLGTLVLDDDVVSTVVLKLVVDRVSDEEPDELVVWAADVEMNDVACVEVGSKLVEDSSSSSSSSSSLVVDVALLLSLDVEPMGVKLLLVIGGVLLLSLDSKVVVSANEVLLDGWEQPLL